MMAITSNHLSGVNNSDIIIHLIDNAIDDIYYTISDTAFNAANNPNTLFDIRLYDYPKFRLNNRFQNYLYDYYA
jgi:hypothetical protein